MNIFTEVIENHILSANDRRWDRTNNRHWPSEASVELPNGNIVGKCLREQYFERNYTPYDRDIAVRIIRIQKVGKAIEQMEINHAKGAGVYVADDIEFKLNIDNIIISGRMDAIYKDSEGNDICVEYKTSEGYWFERDVYGKSFNRTAFPKHEHILQVMCYLKAHDHIPYGVLFYLNRDKLETIEHKINLINDTAYVNGCITEFKMDSMIERWKLLTNYLDEKILPPPDFCPAYNVNDIDSKHQEGKITKKVYEEWLTDDKVPGDTKCMYLCSFKNTCTKSLEVPVIDKPKESGAIIICNKK
jgi:hypothetical protein